nr:upf0664 stress-induced protein [Quercus suber]
MLAPTSKPPFTPLPNEKTLFTSPPRIALALSSPTHYPGRQQKPFSLSASSGVVYLTNRRIIYIPDKPMERLQSFAAPLQNLHDSHVTAPFFGPNVWIAALQPVRGGGIDAPGVELKLTFKEGGAFDFHSSFERVKERHQQVIEVARMNGETSGPAANGLDLRTVDLEELPAYQEESQGPLISPVAASPVIPQHVQSAVHERPTEPPPGYEETQSTLLERFLSLSTGKMRPLYGVVLTIHLRHSIGDTRGHDFLLHSCRLLRGPSCHGIIITQNGNATRINQPDTWAVTTSVRGRIYCKLEGHRAQVPRDCKAYP